MTGSEILKAMDQGATLHSSMFGFWLISPIDARCTNVHNGAAKALARKKRIQKIEDTQWVKTTPHHPNPKLKTTHPHPHENDTKNSPRTLTHETSCQAGRREPDGDDGHSHRMRQVCGYLPSQPRGHPQGDGEKLR